MRRSARCCSTKLYTLAGREGCSVTSSEICPVVPSTPGRCTTASWSISCSSTRSSRGGLAASERDRDDGS